jgi:hypothetical protein
VNLVFSERWMWLWSDNLKFPDGTPAPHGARIVAQLGQARCAGVNAAQVHGGDAPGVSVGFRDMLIPPDDVSVGCGKAGRSVRLMAILPEGDRLIAEFPWRPGVMQVGDGPDIIPPTATPQPPPEPTVTPVTGILLPNTGATGAGNPDNVAVKWLAASASMAIAIAAIVMRHARATRKTVERR